MAALVFHNIDKKLPYFSYFEQKVKKLSFYKDDHKKGKMGQPVKNGTWCKKCTLAFRKKKKIPAMSSSFNSTILRATLFELPAKIAAADTPLSSVPVPLVGISVARWRICEKVWFVWVFTKYVFDKVTVSFLSELEERVYS